jgi:hypothetical protein
MVTKEDIEGFLDRLSADGAQVKEIEKGLWVVRPGGSLDFDVVVHFSPPVVVMRVKVMELPQDRTALAQLSRRLLEMNASEMLHGSYGIEQSAIVITEALELSHLDYEEFQAVYESISLALASHLREIGTLGTSGTHRVPVAVRKKAKASNNGKKSTRAVSTGKARNAKRSKGRSRGRR